MTDTLKRDDMSPSRTGAFDALAPSMQKALKRAATHGAARLPTELGSGWIMVPTRRGLVQVAYSARFAWKF